MPAQLLNLDWPYENRSGYLHIEGASSLDLARRFGTPLYVYSEGRIRKQVRRLREALSRQYSRTRILYAAKANTNLSILRVVREEGAELDAVSPGEVSLALKAGFRPEDILFTSTSVGLEELLYLIDSGVMFNVDSESQLSRLLQQEVPEAISIRVNPGQGAGHHEHVVTAGHYAKFGVADNDAVAVYERAADAGVKRFGIHMHIGSGIVEAGPYVAAAGKLLEVARRVHEEVGVDLDFVDLGGGIGIPYKPDEGELDLDAFLGEIFALVKGKLRDYGLGEPEVWMEPGRFIVAQAGVLLTRVTTLKSTPVGRYMGVDAGFNTLIRPAMYGSYHRILSASAMNEPVEEYDVYGPVCESGDIFARGRPIPRMGEGGLLAIMDAGAYGFSMASRYNSRPLPAEVMVRDGDSRVIRERETLGDLLTGQP